jgi:ADP-heptose:LPS heptosyltransferase
VKPRLLVIELWGLGDLVIASSFLKAAAEKYEVTLLAKPYAGDLGRRFWPSVRTVNFVAPWTAFRGKYLLYNWPWARLLRIRRELGGSFDVALSARWDPRDHALIKWIGADQRLGFPRVGSQIILTRPLRRPAPASHRIEYWKVLGDALSLNLAAQPAPSPTASGSGEILVHSGAGQPIRVWPLDHYLNIVQRLRARGHRVRVACDADQLGWWHAAGEAGAAMPSTVPQLLELIDHSAVFVGNDSGPAHLAAYTGIPTFTLFGPQLYEWFAPLHPQGDCFEGKPCPYKPCSDYCRFDSPLCLRNVSSDEVWVALTKFLDRVAIPSRAA